MNDKGNRAKVKFEVYGEEMVEKAAERKQRPGLPPT
jgi:hypothetical protein